MPSTTPRLLERTSTPTSGSHIGTYREKVDFCISKSGIAKGKVFDIGCGQGGVLKLFEQLDWEAHGVEPDPELARFANHELNLKGV